MADGFFHRRNGGVVWHLAYSNGVRELMVPQSLIWCR